MNHPTATNPAAAEVWETAPGLYEARLHWTLGREPDWIECWLHAGTARVFPWTRVRAYDEAGVLAIYRFDQVQEEFTESGRIWKAYGRDALYGVTDNYLRPDRADRQAGATSQDAAYTEWPSLVADPAYPNQELVSRDTLRVKFGSDDARVTNEDPATRLWAFETDAELDTFLTTHTAESSYSTEPNKIGPNYEGKGVRRGWVFKDIFRHSAGSFDSASRPVLAVYNRPPPSFDTPEDEAAYYGSLAAQEGEALDSNFSQAQAGGAGANALAYDVAVSWPWHNSATPDSGYDYRTVWPGNVGAFAPSGQAVELARRGDFVFDPNQCIDGGQGSTTGLNVTRVEISTVYVLTRRAGPFFKYAFPCCCTLEETYYITCSNVLVGGNQTFTNVTGIPHPPEVCALVPGPGAPPYEQQACRGTCPSMFCFDPCLDNVYTQCLPCNTISTTLSTLSVAVYIGDLGSKNCAGTGPDFYEDIIGFGACPGGCGDPDTITYAIFVPNSCCFLNKVPDGVACTTTTAELLANPALCDNLKTIVPPCNNAAGGWEVLIDGTLIYSRVRAMGMGVNNAGGDTTAFLPGCENTWNPAQNQFHVRREMIVNDYGVNDKAELLNVAKGYVTLPAKKFGGFTTAKLPVWGLPRAGPGAPLPNKPLQAGDRFEVGAGFPGVDPGLWIIDEIEYEFPKGLTMLTLSQRPAAQALPTAVRGNVRTLGESISGNASTFESAWFHVLDQAFKARTALAAEPGKFGVFSFRHHLGVIPTEITMIAAKAKIFDWWDDTAVEAAQPLYVPEYNLEDYAQVQGVGYRVLNANEQEIVFEFPRYLFYDARDGRWIPSEERFIKVWLAP